MLATPARSGKITCNRKASSKGRKKNSEVMGWNTSCSGFAAKGCPDEKNGFQTGMPCEALASGATRDFAE